MPIAMTQEQQALQASLRDWAKHAGTIAQARAQTSAKASAPLAELAALGIFAIPLPPEEASPEEGGTVLDLAAAVEQLACDLAPGPVMPTLLATLLLARYTLPARTGARRVAALLPALAQAQTTACVALTPGTLTGARQPDGTLRVSGETGPVLWAPGHLIACAATPAGDTWFLAPESHPGITVTMLPALDFSRELAAVRFEDTVIAHDMLLNGLDTETVGDLAAMLYAAEAAGVAAWCTGTATDYAATRRQFGRPIGSFQAVKHLCATMACRAERASALAWDTARAADEAPAEHPLAAAAAAALALDDAVANAKDCIQVLGGIGFTWEHDAHLYLRRALALRQLLGGSAPWRARTATLAATGSRRHARPPAPKTDSVIGAWALPAIATYGTQEQRERFGDPGITWCQLFSEPEAGSDLASLRTRAVETDGGWLLTGQKVWTSLAREADWAICLARTDPAVPKHKGITYFLVNMRSPGIEIRPLREITGRSVFNEVFLDDVFVPAGCVLGAPGDGWRIAMSTLATERVTMGGGPALDEAVERLLAVNPVLNERAGFHVASGMVIPLLELREVHPAIRKLIGTEHRQAVAETALELQGPAGAADTGQAADAIYEFLLTRCLSIAGGTTQILLNQVAERVLGLPREPR